MHDNEAVLLKCIMNHVLSCAVCYEVSESDVFELLSRFSFATSFYVEHVLVLLCLFVFGFGVVNWSCFMWVCLVSHCACRLMFREMCGFLLLGICIFFVLANLHVHCFKRDWVYLICLNLLEHVCWSHVVYFCVKMVFKHML